MISGISPQFLYGVSPPTYSWSDGIYGNVALSAEREETKRRTILQGATVMRMYAVH